MQTTPTFSNSDRSTIKALGQEVARRIGRPVAIDYGESDGGQYHDAVLCVTEMPTRSWGSPGPLVSILSCPGVEGEHFAVMGADGFAVADGMCLIHAVVVAHEEALREYRRKVTGRPRVVRQRRPLLEPLVL